MYKFGNNSYSYLFLEQGLMYSTLALNLLCSREWPWSFDPPPSALDCKEYTITSGFTWCWGSNPHPNMLEGILPIHTYHQPWYLHLQFLVFWDKISPCKSGCLWMWKILLPPTSWVLGFWLHTSVPSEDGCYAIRQHPIHRFKHLWSLVFQDSLELTAEVIKEWLYLFSQFLEFESLKAFPTPRWDRGF